MTNAEKTLMLHLNKDRAAMPGKECTDSDYFRRWKKVYPDTFSQIIDAMEDYRKGTIPDFKRDPKKKY